MPKKSFIALPHLFIELATTFALSQRTLRAECWRCPFITLGKQCEMGPEGPALFLYQSVEEF